MLQTLCYQATPIRIGVLSEGYSLGILFGAVAMNLSFTYVNGRVRWPILFSLMMSKVLSVQRLLSIADAYHNLAAFTGALIIANPGNPVFTAAMGALRLQLTVYIT